MRTYKKRVKDIAEVSMLGAGSAIGIGALGGSTASLTGATRYLGTTGKMVGIGMLTRTIDKSLSQKPRKKR